MNGLEKICNNCYKFDGNLHLISQIINILHVTDGAEAYPSGMQEPFEFV